MARRKNTIITSIVILAVIAFIFLAATGFDLPFLTLSGGFTTLSLGQVDFTSNDPVVGGQAWLLTVSQNGAGQYATGNFKLTDGQSSSDSFTVKLSLDENYATYPIQNQNVPIRHVDWVKQTYNPFSSTGGCDMSKWQAWYHPSFGGVYCYKFTTNGYYGTVGSGSVNFKSSINVDGSGGSSSCSITNKFTTSCFASDNRVQASWAGNLVSGQSIPQPTDQNIIAVYDTRTGGWKTAGGVAYNDYKNFNLISCTGVYGEKCFTDYNTFSDKVMGGVAFSSSGGSVARTSGTQSNGQVILDLPTQVQFPVITMRLKATLVGIHIPVGDPQITSASSQQFQTGQTGIIQVTVKNVGGAEGSFDVSATCGSGFNQVGNALRTSVSPGASQTVYLPISANVISSGSSTCTVTARDVNNPANVDTREVSVSASALSVCSSGEKRISANNIEECQNNVWKVISNCGEKVPKYVDGEIQCVDRSDGDEKGFFGKIGDFFKKLYDNTFGALFSGIFNAITIFRTVLVIVVLIFGTLSAKDLFSSFKGLRRKEGIAWVLAFIVGASLVWLVWTFFWIGLIAFVLFLLIKYSPIGRAVGILRR